MQPEKKTIHAMKYYSTAFKSWTEFIAVAVVVVAVVIVVYKSHPCALYCSRACRVWACFSAT